MKTTSVDQAWQKLLGEEPKKNIIQKSISEQAIDNLVKGVDDDEQEVIEEEQPAEEQSTQQKPNVIASGTLGVGCLVLDDTGKKFRITADKDMDFIDQDDDSYYFHSNGKIFSVYKKDINGGSQEETEETSPEHGGNAEAKNATQTEESAAEDTSGQENEEEVPEENTQDGEEEQQNNFIEHHRKLIDLVLEGDIDVAKVEAKKQKEELDKLFVDEKYEDKDFAYKNYMKKSLGKTREQMPQIEPENIDDFLIHFSGKTKIKKIKRKISSLKPTQSDINDDKIIQKIKDKSDWRSRKYIMSLDGYLIDGHHDWAIGVEEDPDAEVDVYRVNLPMKELLHRANKLKFTGKRDLQDNIVKGKHVEVVTVHSKGKTFQRKQMVGTNEEQQVVTKPTKKTEEAPKTSESKKEATKTPQAKSKKEETKTKKERKPQWYDQYRDKYKFKAQPTLNGKVIPKEDVTIGLPAGLKDSTGNKVNWVMKWKDSKGRSIYAYPEEFRQKLQEVKWARLEKISPAQAKLVRMQSLKFLSKPDKKIQEASAVINLLSNTGLRVGQKREFAKTNHRGLSSLAPDNVKIDGDNIIIDFIGKEGVKNHTELKSKELAEYLTNLKKEKKGKDFLFDVDRIDVDRVFKDDFGFKGFKIKDMRTYKAAEMATDFLYNTPYSLPKEKAEVKKSLQKHITDLSVAVSKVLNNKPKMALSSYIPPRIIETWVTDLGVNYQSIQKGESGDKMPKRTLDDILKMWADKTPKDVKDTLSDKEDDDLDGEWPTLDWMTPDEENETAE